MHFFISDIYALFWLMVLLWSKASLKFFWYLKKCFVEEVNEILSPGLMDLIDIHLANIFMGKMSFFFMRKERNFDDFFGDSFGTKLRIVIVIRQTVKGVTHPLPYNDNYIFVALFFLLYEAVITMIERFNLIRKLGNKQFDLRQLFHTHNLLYYTM